MQKVLAKVVAGAIEVGNIQINLLIVASSFALNVANEFVNRTAGAASAYHG